MVATVHARTAPRVVVAGVGDFGADLARQLSDGDRREVVAAQTLEPAFAARPDAVVLAMWRECPSLCDQADQLSFLHRLPWLPIVLEHPRLRVGPWVSPGSGACYRCYRRRKVQHDRQRGVTSALEAAYERDPGCGPAGYLPHHSRLAAGLAEVSLRIRLSDRSGQSAAAEVRTFNIITGQTATHRVIACHGCSRCSPADRLGARGGTSMVLESLRPVSRQEAKDTRPPEVSHGR